MKRWNVGSGLTRQSLRLSALLALMLSASLVRAQATSGSQEGQTGPAAAAADAARECPDGAPCSQMTATQPADGKKADIEEPAGELIGALRNESCKSIGEAFRYGIEGFRQNKKGKVEVALELIHEQYTRVPIIDEARLAVSLSRTMFGRGVEIGVAAWRDLTIDARSRVIGPELTMHGPVGVELIAGAYMGNINIEESWGRFAMARVQAERSFGHLELLMNLQRGRIHRDGDTRSLGDGTYQKYEGAIVLPLAMIPGLHGLAGAIAVSVEDKRTIFGGDRDNPNDREITKIVGYEFPLNAMAAKVANALRRSKDASSATRATR